MHRIHRWWPIAFVVVTLVLWVSDLAVLSPIVAVGALCFAMPGAAGIGGRVTFAGLVAISATYLYVAGATLVGIEASPGLLWVLLSLPALALVGARAPTSSELPWHASVLPVVLGGAALLFILSPAIWLADGSPRNVAQRIALVTSAEDGATHAAITSSISDLGTLPLGAEAEADGVSSTYPAAFHTTAAMLHRSLAGTIDELDRPAAVFDVMWVVGAMVFGLLVATAATISGVLTRRGDGSNLTLLLAMITAGIGCVFWFPADMFLRNFFPQLVAVWLLAALMLLLLIDRPDNYRRTATLLVLLSIGVGAAWPMLLPVVLAAVLGWLWHRRGVARTHPKSTVAAIAVGVAGASAPALLFIVDAVRVDVLNAPGGIEQVPLAGMVVGLCAAVLSVLALPHLTSIRSFGMELHPLLAATALAGALGCYQLVTAGSFSYFFFKLLQPVFVLSIPGIAAIVFLATQRIVIDRVPRIAAGLAVAGLIAAQAGAMDRMTNRTWWFRDGKTLWADALALNQFVSRWDQLQGKCVIVMAGEPTRDYVTSRWTTALLGFNDGPVVDTLQQSLLSGGGAARIAEFAASKRCPVVVLTRQADMVSAQFDDVDADIAVEGIS